MTLYQFRVEENLWNKFKLCLRRIHWEENLSIEKWIIKQIQDFVNENYNIVEKEIKDKNKKIYK